MPDSKRLSAERADDAATRDSQIDALLEEGLDRYFNNRYEDAIHLWTRVLFVDRNHPRARAYIDRARTALAETQRRSEELLQTSRDLIDQGRTDAARELLAEAVAASGDDVQSAALRAQLERRERAQVLATPLPAPSIATAVPGWRWRPTPPLMIAVVAVGALALLLGGLALLDADPSPSLPPVVRSVGTRPATPSASEVALVRARSLFSRGRLAEALQKLDGVAPGSPERVEADSLRVEIQQLLLASVRSSTGSAPSEAVRR
ncbi:MAG TPA: tetratricopeptide repeat protein [Vicinamibacterales bacterium]|nr:tetratricopeptide repeat protein [Vicinamibacterales bacterium]